MQLTQIDTCTFRGLTQLQYLNLSHNELTYLNTSLLDDTKNLLSLDLSYNQLTAVDSNLFSQLVHIEYLAIGHNPFSNLIPTFIYTFFNITYLDMSACNLTVSNFLPLQSFFETSTNHFVEATQFHLEDNLLTSSQQTVSFFNLLLSSFKNVNWITIFMQGNPIYDSNVQIQSLCGLNEMCLVVPDNSYNTTTTTTTTTTSIVSFTNLKIEN